MPINLVDFHCHLDLYPDFAGVVQECDQKEVHTLAVTTTPKAWPKNREITLKTHFVQAALGLHPQLVAQRASEFQLWENYLTQARFIGEVGLDNGPRFYRTLGLQKEVFAKILTACYQSGGKILSVHSVHAASIVLDMIEKYLPSNRCRVVLHWFTGNKADTLRAIDIGCYFSINAEMFKKKSHLNMLTVIPPDRILTETDGPFCIYHGKPIHPINVLGVLDLISMATRKDIESIGDMVYANYKRINEL